MSPTRSSKPAPDASDEAARKALERKYANILEAVARAYPAAVSPLTTSVLIGAGANPSTVPTTKPFDEHGYYQMDWQQNVRWKNPWPTDVIRDDALTAARLEKVEL